MKHVKIRDQEAPCESRASRRPATAASTRSIHTRDSMGRYTGEAPLTIHERATPSGFDYRPKTSLTTRKPPEYSITGKPYCYTKSQRGPSPGDHEVSGDLCWDEEKTFYMSPKRKTWPYAAREDAHLTCSTGAGHYKVVYRDTGSATKHSVSSRHKDKINIGPPNSCIQPVDTFGVETPGPDYMPNSPYWGRGPKHHFGVRLQQKSAETPGPGPGAYVLPSDLESVPAPVIGEKLYADNNPEYPAPNAYNIPETVGTGLKRSFGIKHNAATISRNPPPNNYIIREPKRNGPSMTYRAFHWPSESTAGPSDHNPSMSHARPRTAEYSCREKCRPVFPDILNYSAEYGPELQPAPGQYGYDREFRENSNPAHSIGALLPVKPNDNPGPNRYHINHSNRSDICSVPSYSMAQVLPKTKSKEETPAPCDYQEGCLKPNTPSYSMTPRRQHSKGAVGPSPNAFNISRGQNHKGKSTGASYSLSSRHSPYKYSGFPSAALAKL